MIDEQGYRANIGIVIANNKGQTLLAKRFGKNSWQFPQGGIDRGEDELAALYRELYEEVGLGKHQVEVIAKTPKWLRYELPKQYVRNDSPACIGQKQVWFLLKLTAPESSINLCKHKEIEFDDWKWVDYWSPIEQVIPFKRDVYEDMLKALAPVLFNNNHQVPRHCQRPLKFSAILYTPLHK